MSTLKISDLWIYPIKSLAGIQLKKAQVEKRGLQYDRRWVLVDMEGVFVNQREFPEMNFLQPAINSHSITISHKHGKKESLSFSLTEPDSDPIEVSVWDDQCTGKPVSEEADEWFSDFLGKQVRLLFMHKKGVRPADQRYALSPSDEVSYADGYPILMISEASLALLNEKTEEHIPMNRFRANIIVSGATAHQEDSLREIEIGEVKLYGVKPCARCVMTTINIETGLKGKEPLKSLASYRKVGYKILFGENFIPAKEGVIEVGQEITIQATKAPAI
ncbi:MOSC domain-containing protein [Roseivirga sp.]|uniref:MOSC domain-containing protein n=1 Tax=Roseivirga sp. TaxID=1964215 RepID=UPI003B8AC635